MNHNTKLFTFELPDPDGILGLVVNSCILAKYKGPNDEKPIVRPYTPISEVDEKVQTVEVQADVGIFRLDGEEIS